MLELIGDESTYEPGEKAKQQPPIPGAGGTELFRFKTLKTVETEITLVYKRPWEESTPQDVTKVFTVNIK